ncbi:MAG TPA: sigma-70 family RNA polymerase sigma factor [Armatimonadota bacterium]|nr:sigma-70 family RNA polymerase sigma factor [Armatimonadota bacterium]HOP79442.1 sigma-70 family RNA polymerase sigma factor [Armatimonadota bacterium]
MEHVEYGQTPAGTEQFQAGIESGAGTAAIRGKAIVTGSPPLTGRTEQTDSDLVMRARDGDLAAYSELVQRYQRAVYGIVSRMVSSRDDVDDVVQDVFILAYKSIGRFRGQSAFSTWLHSIAVNTAIKYLRKNKTRQAMSIDDTENGIENSLVSEAHDLPPDAAEIEERKRAVRLAVEKLPEKHRVVVILHYFEDYSCEEIAKITKCSVGTVWSRLHYACKKLRGQLDWLETA